MSNIVDLNQFKKKKQQEVNPSPTRGTTLYVPHRTGKITGSPNQSNDKPDFGDRLTRIRQSLEKINSLMAELKQMSAGTDPRDKR